MQYLLKLIYLDDKDVSIVLEENQVTLFLEAFKKNEPYWQNKNESAFMVPQAQIRYVNIQKVAEKPKEVKPEEPKVEDMPELDRNGAPIEEVKKG